MVINCCSCGRVVDEKEYGTVRLKDGQAVCKDCADKTRILYPFKFSKVLTRGDIAEGWTRKGEAIYGMTVKGRRYDPLTEMSLEEFRDAMEASLKAAEEQAARYAGAKAVIEADHVRKYYVNVGSEKNPKYHKRKVYGVFGKVLHGELTAGMEVAVSHKDKEYSARIDEVQDWDGTGNYGMPVAKVSAGKLVNMMFMQEMNFVYPGDLLVVR